VTAALRTFALAAGCLASTVAFAQAVLWEGVKEGMSVSEVRRIFINATSSDGGKLVTGAEELLRVNRYQFAGADFVVRFFFLDRKLTQVQLARDEWAANADNRKVFDEISTQLRAKYGREKSRTVSQRSSGLSADAEWSAPGRVGVKVSVVPVTQATSMLLLNYRAE
jgi:hypothetical protein